uniref:Homeobox domain-containing protein n=1 Tax=Leersia perrieri TaxID=77586 RepID=A0A0D9WJP9_9ORYZ
MDSSGDGGDEGAGAASASASAGKEESPPPASASGPAPALNPAPAAVGGGAGASGSSGKVKRVMKTPYQLEVLERTYTEDPYPNETMRADLSVKLGLTDRQLQMWFCHRRLKDRKPPPKRQQLEEEVPVPVMAPPPVLPPPLPHSELTMGTAGMYGEPLPPSSSRRGSGRPSAVPRLSAPDVARRYYEPPQVMLPPMAPMQLTRAEHRVIDSVERLIGEPLRDDGPVLGVEFDPLPPGAFGAPIVPDQQRQPFRSYEAKMFSGHDTKHMKASAFLPSVDPFVPNTVTGKRKSMAGNSPHLGSRAVREYQFIPEQSSDIYERTSHSRYYDVSTEASDSRMSTGSRFLHGVEKAPGYHGHISGSSHLTLHGRPSVFPSGPTDYEMDPSNINASSVPNEGQYGIPPVVGYENSLAPSDRMVYHDEDAYRIDRKRKHNEEAKIAKEVEAHEKRIRKELEKQDILNRKAEKIRQKEELRKEKEAARQKAANERATARRIAREYMELMEDERLELMELVSQSKGLPSMLSLDSDTLQQLDSFRGMLRQFPSETVRLKVPFSVKPWTSTDDNIGNLLMVWKFFITFADVLGIPSFTLDEFVQSLHDYDSRLLGELHVSLLKSIIKDIEDVARTPSVASGMTANPGGGHPQIVEGAYDWGFNILAWQRHLNLLTWPEILRQFGLSAGFGPHLKKRNAENVNSHDDNEGRNGEDVISILRSGSAAVNAAAKMKERGYTNRRRSRHRLTPGTVKFAAFHVLSLEGSKGLTILEVAEKIQKSGLRDLTTSKTPEASISAALSRDSKLFERTAPSTYCVKTPYRKDPADSEAVLAAAREKIRLFQNTISECEEVEKDVDDAERDEDSECDDADDDPDGDEVNIEEKDVKAPLVKAQDSGVSTAVGDTNKERNSVANASISPLIHTKSPESISLHTPDKSGQVHTTSDLLAEISSDNEVAANSTQDAEIDESNQGESWVQGLAEGDYCDLSVEERLNALVALIGVATEGNSIRAVLEERLEAASALKKQMWAEAQLDKRRSREDFSTKMQYDSGMGLKVDVDQPNSLAESTLTPVHNLVKDNNGNGSSVKNELPVDQQSQPNAGNIVHERNGVKQEFSANPENLSAQQYVTSEKTRSQLKAYIGHKAEQLHVYRSLPLGQDRRRNRYWQFSTSASPDDPGSARIFFESRDGYWRLIDSVEAFDALVSSLDTRGIRESHLHSMLQSIESTFKEAIGRKRCASIEPLAGRVLKNGTSEIISPNHSNEFGSPCSTLSGAASDSAMAYSDSFRIELGRNDVEKTAISKRADVFIKWMWKECNNHQLTSAMKHGKKRCSDLIQCCDSCYQIYLAEETHCASCHKTFKSIHNISDHSSQCEEKQKTDPNWKMQISDNSVHIGLRLLKLLLATIEASVPAEALEPSWTDVYRKSWGVKLYSTSSTEEVFKMLTILEGAIRRNFLSSDFEITTELLNSNTQDSASQNIAGRSGSADVLPWVPDTIAAVALRLLDLDSAISYTLQQKVVSNKERGAGEFMKLPPRYTPAKAKQETEPLGTGTFDRQETWLTPSNGRRGRGRGGRGGSRGGRSRSRGGKVPRGIGSSPKIEFRGYSASAMPSEKAPRKYARRGRNRGRGRGLRTVRPRQPADIGARSIPKENLLGSFSMLRNTKHTATVESPQSSGAEEWGLERRPSYAKDDEDNSVSQSDESSEEDNSEPMNEYDEQLPDYSRDNSGSSPLQMMDDGSDDNEEDAEGDDGEEDGEDYDAEQHGDEDNDDAEMDEDDVEDNDDGGGGAENGDDDEDGTSYSSEYSE